MVAAMGRLWLLPWDGYGCCYGCCHGMAMVAAMVVAMVAAMVAAMGWLWLLPWESGVIMMTIAIAMAERSDNDGHGRAE